MVAAIVVWKKTPKKTFMLEFFLKALPFLAVQIVWLINKEADILSRQQISRLRWGHFACRQRVPLKDLEEQFNLPPGIIWGIVSDCLWYWSIQVFACSCCIRLWPQCRFVLCVGALVRAPVCTSYRFRCEGTKCYQAEEKISVWEM